MFPHLFIDDVDLLNDSTLFLTALLPEGEPRILDASCWLPAYKDIHKSYCVMGEMNESLAQNKALIFDSTSEEVVEQYRNYISEYLNAVFNN